MVKGSLVASDPAAKMTVAPGVVGAVVFRSGVLVLLDDFKDAVGHAKITRAVVVIPLQIHFEKLFAFPVDGDTLAVLLECVKEMLGCSHPTHLTPKLSMHRAKAMGRFVCDHSPSVKEEG